MEDRLRKFACLVDAGSFTKAARELHLSQPALSAAIGKLERELRVPLLVHGVRPLSITPAGQLAYATAKELHVSTDNLTLRLAELKKRKITLAVGMIDSVASTLFASEDALKTLQARAHLSVIVNNSRYLLQALEHGQLDMAFVVTPKKRPAAGLEIVPVASEPLVLVCHPKHAARMQAAMALGEVPDFISYDQSSTTFQHIANTLQGQKLQLCPVFYSTSPEVMLRLVLLGRGAAVLPYLLVRDAVAKGTICVLRSNSPLVIGREVSIAHRRGKQLAAPLQAVSQRLRQDLEALTKDALLITAH
jgi:DNA-binding transcriptional LysR family regulator